MSKKSFHSRVYDGKGRVTKFTPGNDFSSYYSESGISVESDPRELSSKWGPMPSSTSFNSLTFELDFPKTLTKDPG